MPHFRVFNKSNGPNSDKRVRIGTVVQMASPARFELTTFRLGGGRSILLSYGDILGRGLMRLPQTAIFIIWAEDVLVNCRRA